MKLKRLLAFSLSMAMMISVMPALVLADDFSFETTETTIVETTETEEKETEKSTTKNTEEPTETEDKKPEETKADESSEAEETEPSETEETHQTEGKEDEIHETQKGKAVSKTPKAASTLPEIKLKVSYDGILTWEPVEGCKYVDLYIRWDNGDAVSIIIGNSTGKYNLKDFIDREIVDPESRVIEGAQSDTHYCMLSAFVDLNTPAVARTEFVYKYKSSEKPITIGTISNVRISPEGIIEWDPYEGADEYRVYIDGYDRSYTKTKCDLNEQIDFFVKNWSSFKVKDSYEITVKARMKYKDTTVTIASWTGRYPKVTNPMTVKAKTAKVKYKKLRKKKQTVKCSKMITVSGAQGKLTYKIVSVNKKKSYFKINSNNGNVTIKKKLKKGTYKLKVSVTAAGNDNYKPITQTVSFKIKVK